MKTLSVLFDENKKYDIIIDPQTFQMCGTKLKELFPKAKKIAVICDDVVEKLYAIKVLNSIKNHGFECFIIPFAHGEASKSHENLIMIYDKLTQYKFTLSLIHI